MSDDKKTDEIVNQHGEGTGLAFANFSGEINRLTPEQKQAEEDRLAKIDKLGEEDIEKGKTASTMYWEAESAGESIRGIYQGFKKITTQDENTKEDKLLIAVVIKTSKGNMLAAGTHVVEAFIGNGVPEGSAVHITYQGKKNRMKLFEVKVLDA